MPTATKTTYQRGSIIAQFLYFLLYSFARPCAYQYSSNFYCRFPSPRVAHTHNYLFCSRKTRVHTVTTNTARKKSSARSRVISAFMYLRWYMTSGKIMVMNPKNMKRMQNSTGHIISRSKRRGHGKKVTTATQSSCRVMTCMGRFALSSTRRSCAVPATCHKHITYMLSRIYIFELCAYLTGRIYLALQPLSMCGVQVVIRHHS